MQRDLASKTVLLFFSFCSWWASEFQSTADFSSLSRKEFAKGCVNSAATLCENKTPQQRQAPLLRGFSSLGPEQSWHLLLSTSPQAPGSWVWLEKMILRLALAAREAGKPVSTLSLERRDSQGKLPQNIRKVGGPGARQSPSRVTDNRQWDPQGVLIFSGPYHSAAQKRQKHQLWIYLKLQLPEYVLELDHFSCKSWSL